MDSHIVIIVDLENLSHTHLWMSAERPVCAVTFGSSAKKICSSSYCPIFLKGGKRSNHRIKSGIILSKISYLYFWAILNSVFINTSHQFLVKKFQLFPSFNLTRNQKVEDKHENASRLTTRSIFRTGFVQGHSAEE